MRSRATTRPRKPTSRTSDRPERASAGHWLERIGHFFEHYKDLEKGKWVKLDGWGNAAEAKAVLVDAIARQAAQPDSEKHKF